MRASALNRIGQPPAIEGVGVYGVGPQAQAYAPTPRMVLAAFVGFLRRNSIWIVVASALAAGFAFLGLMLVLNKYSATATIIVDPRIPNVTQGASVLPHIGSDVLAVESLVQVTKSSGFLAALVHKLDLARDDDPVARETAIEKLGAALTVSRRGTTYVLEATASDRSPEQSARIANAAAEAIIQDQRALHAGADDQTVGDIARRLDEVRSRVAADEQAAADMRAELKIADVGQGSTLLQRRLFELNQQYVLASTKVEQARARYEQVRNLRVESGDNLAGAPVSVTLASLKTQRAALMRQAADQATTLGPRHPSLIAIQAQIAEANRQIATELGRMQNGLHADLLEAEQQEKAQKRQLQDAQQDSDTLGPRLVKLDELERNAKAERTVLEQLLTRQRELVGERNLEPSDIHFVSRAEPATHLKPTTPVRAALAGVIGLLCGLVSAFFRETMSPADRKAPDPSETFAGLAVVGRSPLISKATASARGSVDLAPWLSSLRSVLTARRRGRAGQVVLIAAAHEGAGCSTVAAGLAASLAGEGARVLLIEAHRPHSPSRSEEPGLLEVLQSGEDLGGVLVESDGVRYTRLPFGGAFLSRKASIEELFRGVTVLPLLVLCRRWFEFVVIDGPPALEVSYSHALARLANVSVFVVESDKTSISEANEALERLGAQNAMVFMNKCEEVSLRGRDPSPAGRAEKAHRG